MGRTLVVKIVDTVAEAKDVNPQELGYSLEEHVDTEALQLLADNSSSTWKLTFTLPAYEVTVTSEGVVRVEERQEINI